VGAPNAQDILKEWIRIAARPPITTDLIEDGAKRIADICAADEFQRGLSDLLAKRKPHWLLNKKRAAPKTKEPVVAHEAVPKNSRKDKNKATPRR
jgi:hypothetical protein